MRCVKKLVLTIATIFILSTSVYAIETSIGLDVVGIGASLLRQGESSKFALSNPSLLSFNVMVEFMPYLALETGVWFESLDLINTATDREIDIFGVYVPIMLRAQYEYKVGVTYVSVGVKVGYSHTSMALEPDTFLLREFDNYGRFAMDVAFAVGQEFRLGDANYLGLRLNYDLSVVKKSRDFTYDSFGLALTYRYAFGSKWKKVSSEEE